MATHIWRRHDVLVSVGLAMFAYYGARAAYQHLHDIRLANRIKQPKEETPEFFTPQTEDAIGEETLATLLRSPNPDIATAAKRLLIERILRHQNAPQRLVANIAGKHGRQLQEESLKSLKYLCFSAQVRVPFLDKALRGLVYALKNRLPEVLERSHLPDTDWKLRTQGECDAMSVLGHELESDAPSLIKSTRLVEDWVAKYPFGGKDAPQIRKLSVVDRLIRHQTDDDLLGRIMACIHRTAIGRKQLRAAGLIGSAIREGHTSSDGDLPVYVDEVTSVLMPPESLENPNEDPEVRLRRRRRNAVVYEDVPD